MKLHNNNHSVFSLHYHLIMVVKYRRKAIDDKISLRLKEIFEYIGDKHRIVVVEWNHDTDHVHVLFRAEPRSELSHFINAYKSAGSRLIKKEFSRLRSILWKEVFWSRSFCLISMGGAPLVTIRRYIEEQGEK